MAIGYSDTRQYCTGIIEVSLEDNPSLHYSFDIRNLIYNDVKDVVTRYGFPSAYYWQGLLFTEVIPSQATKFKSALPKYDFGSYALLSAGAVAGEGFWNYPSQWLPNQFSYFLEGLPYPSKQSNPEPPIISDAIVLGGFTDGYLTGKNDFADAIEIQLNYIDLFAKFQVQYFFNGEADITNVYSVNL